MDVLKAKGIFINLTNHPSSGWSEEQRAAAERFGQIVDVPFPSIDPTWDTDKVRAVSDVIVKDIINRQPNAVLCQGEFVSSHLITCQLLAHGIGVCVATTRRQVVEKTLPDGSTQKISVFRFVHFRWYEGV